MKDIFDGLIEQLMDKGFFLEEAVELLEQSMISRALTSTRGNQSAASKMLGIHRNTLQRKISEYKLNGDHSVRAPRKPPGRATVRKGESRKKIS